MDYHSDMKCKYIRYWKLAMMYERRAEIAHKKSMQLKNQALMASDIDEIYSLRMKFIESCSNTSVFFSKSTDYYNRLAAIHLLFAAVCIVTTLILDIIRHIS